MQLSQKTIEMTDRYKQKWPWFRVGLLVSLLTIVVSDVDAENSFPIHQIEQECLHFSTLYSDFKNYGGEAKPIAQGIRSFRILKGTTFFGGAGMGDDYIPDMITALKESGLKQVRVADPKIWSNGLLLDVVGTIFDRTRDDEPSNFDNFDVKGEQFNLIGYSHGGLQAAQAAADYADEGGKVDHIVLIATPIGNEFIEYLKNHQNIENVILKNLGRYGDPIKSGMSVVRHFLSAPSVIHNFYTVGKGHFYYSGNNNEGANRRRYLAKWLRGQGLR